MKLILYSNGNEDVFKKLMNKITPVIPEREVDVYRDMNNLIRRLKGPKSGISVMVLVTDRNNLSDLLSFRDFFMDQRIILVLPDGEKETMADAFKFYPRFYTTMDSNFVNLQAVLYKMLGKKEKSVQ